MRLLLLVLLGCMALRAEVSADRPGLSVGEGGALLLHGKPWCDMGVNYFDAFLRVLKEGSDTTYRAGFAELGRKKIPFARVCATGFWPVEMRLYREDRAEYLRRLDDVVAAAKVHGVGLVLSLFWHYSTVPDLVEEPMQAWGEPGSRTQVWMAEYVREIVGRYAKEPTVWAWEFGNEFSLKADLPNAKEQRPAVHPMLGTAKSRSERDDLTSAMLSEAFAAFGREVRRHDAHRLVVSGDSFPRESAWHQARGQGWKKDSPAQLAEVLEAVTPEPLNGISVHAYEEDHLRFGTLMETARRLGKPVFIGEFGAQGESAAQGAKLGRLVQAIVEHRVPLSALWVFDFAKQQDFNVTATNARAWQLEMVAQVNWQLQTEKR